MLGFHNKALHIDIGQRSYREEAIDDEILQRLLGGKGLATHLLQNNTTAGIDPLSAENVIIFATGPVTDTKIFGSARYGIFTKSPLTGTYSESYAGGGIAETITRTGYDSIVIKGVSQSPVWLEVNPRGVTFHDASHIWGRDTHETEDIIKKEVGIRDAGVIVIGLAGENQIRFAVITNEYWRSAGRGGAGAVLGSKRIKGIAFHGDRKRKIADAELIEKFRQDLRALETTGKVASSYRQLGTPMIVAMTNKAGAFPTRYWSSGKFDRWQEISAEALLEKCQVKSRACPKCLLSCIKLTRIVDGRHEGLIIEGPEYETIYAFGGLCLIDDIREIAYLNDICDKVGMDTITAGNLAAFTIEAGQRKEIGVKIDYGDVDAIAGILNKIARREEIGNTLAEGIRHASQEWGLEDLAIHVKGMEPAGYDPRTLKGMGLAYATSDRGACHLRATVYKAELSGTLPPDQIEGKAELLVDFEDRHTLFDALIVCRFFRDLYLWNELSLIIKATTGMDLDKEELRQIAANITNLTRDFNRREGVTSRDDRLPKRFLEEKLSDSGKVLPQAELEKMLDDYYSLRGWGPHSGD